MLRGIHLLMQVIGLFLKSIFSSTVQPQPQLQLRQGFGIDTDCHAQVGSPRQVLLQDLPTLEKFGLQPGDLQENILLSHGLAMLRSGFGLKIGDVLIRLTFRCEPCAYLETLQPGLARRIGQQRGWLGMVITSGTIALRDSGILTDEPVFPALAAKAKHRFYEFVATIPTGTVVTTQQLLCALGVTSAYYRAIPGLIKRAPAQLPVYRIVGIDGRLLINHIPQQADRLTAEGVEIQAGKVLPSFCWQPEHYWHG